LAGEYSEFNWEKEQRRNIMNKTISLLSCMCLLFVFNTAQATIQSAEEVVMTTADAVLARLATESEALDADPGKIYGLVNEIVIPHFDFVSMSKWVLGKKNWRGASESQRVQFVHEFRTLLIRTYAKALLEYSDEEIVYLPVEKNPDSNLVVVKTKINQAGSTAVPIDYRMHVSGGEWKVVDLVVDGVSLVSTYRGSFASQIKKSGFESLISKLSQRNSTMVTAEDSTASN
jgi:phospholipid transport system substrate-binding protein